jgi:PAT family beta-lactamase induction signal transducer AmpG
MKSDARRVGVGLDRQVIPGFLRGDRGKLQRGRSLLDAYALFYLLAAALGLPAILLCIVLARVQPTKADA